jgi:hypothetical protein
MHAILMHPRTMDGSITRSPFLLFKLPVQERDDMMFLGAFYYSTVLSFFFFFYSLLVLLYEFVSFPL